MVKPKPKCTVEVESTFSVTGFLTFAVVAVTAVGNVLANINNNNDLNNNNNNQDNVNNNNQNVDSAMAMNMGNARQFASANLTSIFDPERFLCTIASQPDRPENAEDDLDSVMRSLAGFMLVDHFESITPEIVLKTVNGNYYQCS